MMSNVKESNEECKALCTLIQKFKRDIPLSHIWDNNGDQKLKIKVEFSLMQEYIFTYRRCKSKGG